MTRDQAGGGAQGVSAAESLQVYEQAPRDDWSQKLGIGIPDTSYSEGESRHIGNANKLIIKAIIRMIIVFILIAVIFIIYTLLGQGSFAFTR